MKSYDKTNQSRNLNWRKQYYIHTDLHVSLDLSLQIAPLDLELWELILTFTLQVSLGLRVWLFLQH